MICVCVHRNGAQVDVQPQVKVHNCVTVVDRLVGLCESVLTVLNANESACLAGSDSFPSRRTGIHMP